MEILSLCTRMGGWRKFPLWEICRKWVICAVRIAAGLMRRGMAPVHRDERDLRLGSAGRPRIPSDFRWRRRDRALSWAGDRPRPARTEGPTDHAPGTRLPRRAAPDRPASPVLRDRGCCTGCCSCSSSGWATRRRPRCPRRSRSTRRPQFAEETFIAVRGRAADHDPAADPGAVRRGDRRREAAEDAALPDGQPALELRDRGRQGAGPGAAPGGLPGAGAAGGLPAGPVRRRAAGIRGGRLRRDVLDGGDGAWR